MVAVSSVMTVGNEVGVVAVTFDRAVTEATAINLLNYSFAPSWTPKHACLSADAKTVTLKNFVPNGFPFSENLIEWTRTAGVTLDYASGVLAPYGRKAWMVTFDGGPRYLYPVGFANGTLVTGQTYTFSGWIWTDTGTKSIRLQFEYNTGSWVSSWSPILTITTTPTRWFHTVTVPTNGSNTYFLVGNDTASGGGTNPTAGNYYIGGFEVTGGSGHWDYTTETRRTFIGNPITTLGVVADSPQANFALGTPYTCTVSGVIGQDSSTMDPLANSGTLELSEPGVGYSGFRVFSGPPQIGVVRGSNAAFKAIGGKPTIGAARGSAIRATATGGKPAPGGVTVTVVGGGSNFNTGFN